MQTDLTMPTRSRSALTAARATASTSASAGFSGAADASMFLGASAGAAGAAGAGLAASTFFSGSIMELPFSLSDAVTFM